MKKTFLLLLFFLLPVFLMGQDILVDFESEAEADTTFWGVYRSDNSNDTTSNIVMSLDTEEYVSGASSMRIDYKAQNAESWGGFVKIEHYADSMEVFNWSTHDSISFWYNNIVPQDLAGRIHLRFNIGDVSDVAVNTMDANQTEFYYSFHYILDNEPGWQEIVLPLVDGRNDPDLNEWGGEAFNRTGWGGVTGNDELDPDQIKWFAFEFSIDAGAGGGAGEIGAGSILIDQIALKGSKNSLAAAPGFEDGDADEDGIPDGWGGWQSAWDGWGSLSHISTVMGGANTGDYFAELGVDAGNGYAVIFQSAPAAPKHEIQLSAFIKDMAPAGLGDTSFAALKLEAKSGSTVLQAWEDFQIGVTGEWQQFSTRHVMPEGTDTVSAVLVTSKWLDDGVAAVYGFDDVVLVDLGVIDDVPPESPVVQEPVTNPTNNFNLVIWEDVPGEQEATYNVYASKSPISDINADGVVQIAAGVAEETQSFVHHLRYPLQDKEVDYYYAVTCKDRAGNVSEPGLSASMVTNTAKGVAVISDFAPDGFVADGDPTEWENAGIMPFVITPETGYAWGDVTDSDDLTGNVYLAVDDDNLYFMADVIDDVYGFGEGNWWDQDAFQMFFGLYNQQSLHTSIMRGDEPDYVVYSNETGFIRDYSGLNSAPLYTPDHENFYFEEFGGLDYVVEAKIPLDSIAADGDARFQPKRGMRIPIELYFHDNDGNWEGNLGISPVATDLQWQSVQQWTWTWIGDTDQVAVTAIGDREFFANSFELKQNYPNPFNPTTKIEYSIAKNVDVTISLYNSLGQKIRTLVDGRHAAGTHFIQINASDLASGVYFYQIEAGEFVQTRKMLLMK